MVNNKKWYAAYTKPRAEKKVAERLTSLGFENFLPLLNVRKKWSDRYKWVEIPLINSYIFLLLDEKELNEAIKIDGIVRYICFNGRPNPIPENQINSLKIIVQQKDIINLYETEITNKDIEAGETIIITKGPFLGLEAELVEIRGSKKVVVRLQSIGQSILLTLPLNQIELANKQ